MLLQQAANCFLAAAALFPASIFRTAFGHIIFSADRHRRSAKKGLSVKFSNKMALASDIVKLNGYSQASWL
jgi:hypothetical protein